MKSWSIFILLAAIPTSASALQQVNTLSARELIAHVASYRNAGDITVLALKMRPLRAAGGRLTFENDSAEKAALVEILNPEQQPTNDAFENYLFQILMYKTGVARTVLGINQFKSWAPDRTAIPDGQLETARQRLKILFKQLDNIEPSDQWVDQFWRGETEYSARIPKKKLSPKDEKVFVLLTRDGLPNKLIACEMSISIKSVEKHRQAVLNKLNAHTSALLIRRALESGLSALESDPPPLRKPLSPREKQTLDGIARDCTNEQIARELGISAKAIDKYRQRLYKKLNLGIHGVIFLLRRALSLGLVH